MPKQFTAWMLFILASELRAGLPFEQRFQKFPRFHLAVARHLYPHPLMEKRIQILNQRDDLA